MNFLLWAAMLNDETPAPAYLVLGAFTSRAEAEAAAAMLAETARWTGLTDTRSGAFTPASAPRYLSPAYFPPDYFGGTEPAAGPGH